jgi:hypothetical protein
MKLGSVFFGGSRGKCPGGVHPRFANHVEFKLAPSEIIMLDDVNSQEGIVLPNKHAWFKLTLRFEEGPLDYTIS